MKPFGRVVESESSSAYHFPLTKLKAVTH